MSFEIGDNVVFKVSLENGPGRMIVKEVVAPLGEFVVVFWFDKNSAYQEEKFKSEWLVKV